jgi:hypothetical protein
MMNLLPNGQKKYDWMSVQDASKYYDQAEINMAIHKASHAIGGIDDRHSMHRFNCLLC